MAIPGAGFFLNQGSKLKDGIMSLNNQIQNSNFGRSKNLMDYLDIKNYGGYDEREMTRRINMDEAKLLQADIDSGMYDGMGVKPVQTFEFDPSNFNTRNVTTVNNFDDIEGQVADASTTPTFDERGISLIDRVKLKNVGFNDSQINEAFEGGYLDDIIRSIEPPLGGSMIG